MKSCPVHNQGEARLAVNELSSTEQAVWLANKLLNPDAAASRISRLRMALGSMLGKNYVHLEGSPADQLKVVEYALLVDPISKGVESFVRSSGINVPSLSECIRFRPDNITSLVGQQVHRGVSAALEDSPHRKTIERLAEVRGNLLSYGTAISPLDDTIKAAAKSSAVNMYSSAVANVMAAHRAIGSGASRYQLVDIARRSHQLPLSRPMIHLTDQHEVSDKVDEFNFALANNSIPDIDLLRYEPDTNKVVLNKNPKQWGLPPAVNYRGEAIVDSDVPIGCPITFSPRLVRSYYEAMVDVVEAHDIWPAAIRQDIGIIA